MKWIARIMRSKTMVWGHIQLILGAVLAVLEYVNPELIVSALKDATPIQILLISAIYSAITYYLRLVTTQPLKEK